MRRIEKFILTVTLAFFLLKSMLKAPSKAVDNRGFKHKPLLEQKVDKSFNKKKLWVSMSLCYSALASRKSNRDLLAQTLLSTALWRTLSNANVVLQIYNDTLLLEEHSYMVKLMEKRKVKTVWAYKKTPTECICDCALQAEVGRILLHHHPELKGVLKEEDIVILSSVNSFISKPHFLNVFKSSHSAWMFVTEAVFYGGKSWPTNFIGMTVANWKLITFNSTSCSELSINDPFLASKYSPPWKLELDESKRKIRGNYILSKLNTTSRSLQQLSTLWKSNLYNAEHFDNSLSLILNSQFEMLSYLINQTFHFVDLKPIYFDAFFNLRLDAENIIGITLLLLDNIDKTNMDASSVAYITEHKRIMTAFQLEVQSILESSRTNEEETVKQKPLILDEAFKRG